MKAEAIVDSEGSGSFTLEGTEPRHLAAGSESAAVAEVLRLTVTAAAAAAESVELTAHLPGRVDVLLVSPYGAIERISAEEHVAVAELHQEEQTASATPIQRAGRRNATMLGVAAAGLTGVLLVGGVGFVGLGGDEPTTAAGPSNSAATATIRIHSPVPPKWTQRASWAADLAEGTDPVVTSDKHVAHIGPDDTVYVTDPATGKTLLTSRAKSAPTSLGVFVEPTSGVAWLADGELHTWTADDGEKSFPAEAGAELRVGGGSPMLWKQGSTEVAGIASGKLVRTALPDDTIPLGIVDDTVVSSDLGPSLWRTPLTGGKPTSVPLSDPASDAGRVIRRWIGMEGDRMLIAWSVPGKPKKTTIRLYDARTGEVLDQINAPWSRIEWAVLVSSADRLHPAVGPVFVEDTTMLLARDTRVVALGTRATRYGLLDETPGLVDDRGGWTSFPAGTTVPSGIGSNGEAIIHIGERVYALPLAK